MILGEISALKLAWTLASFVGSLVTLALVLMAMTDYRLLKIRGLNSWRQQVARTSIIIFFGGFVAQSVYFIAGVLALTQSNKYGSSLLVRHVTQGLFLFAAIAGTILALIIFYRRVHILEVIEKELKREHEHE